MIQEKTPNILHTEQKRIFTVGACLTCHIDNSEMIRKSLEDLPKEIAEACVLPGW